MKQEIINIEDFEKVFSQCTNNQERLNLLLAFEYGLRESEIKKLTLSSFRNLI